MLVELCRQFLRERACRGDRSPTRTEHETAARQAGLVRRQGSFQPLPPGKMARAAEDYKDEGHEEHHGAYHYAGYGAWWEAGDVMPRRRR